MNNIEIKKAAGIIKNGGVVAFPTETVYGLGADATDQNACQKIFEIKGRPSINPLIVHIENISIAEALAEFNQDAYSLAETFWPGPLTIVLPLKSMSNIAPCVLAGNNTVALRMPAHAQALALIKEAGCPVAAPSANPSGYISSTLQEHVVHHFGSDEVFIVNDLSMMSYGLESTIMDLSTRTPTILRYGFVTPDAIERILEKPVQIAGALMQIKAPGMLDKHYAPRVQLKINGTNVNENEIALNFGLSNLISDYSLNLSENGDLVEAAANFYTMLRLLDEYAVRNNIGTIVVAPIPNLKVGLAINDRLSRAAFSW